MQIVIELDDNIYGLLKRTERLFKYIDEENDTVETALMKAVADGTPLPEHHGRLIDADALLDKKQDYGEGQMKLILIDPYYVRKAPTIIEADKGSDSE